VEKEKMTGSLRVVLGDDVGAVAILAISRNSDIAK